MPAELPRVGAGSPQRSVHVGNHGGSTLDAPPTSEGRTGARALPTGTAMGLLDLLVAGCWQLAVLDGQPPSHPELAPSELGLYKDIVKLLGLCLCARINHPSIAPSHLLCPHYCNTLARLLCNAQRPPSPLCLPYTIPYW